MRKDKRAASGRGRRIALAILMAAALATFSLFLPRVVAPVVFGVPSDPETDARNMELSDAGAGQSGNDTDAQNAELSGTEADARNTNAGPSGTEANAQNTERSATDAQAQNTEQSGTEAEPSVMDAEASNVEEETRGAFLESLLRAIARFPDGGGYDVALMRSPEFSQSVWDGIDRALSLDPEGFPAFDLSAACPSFCSSACYLALMNALWDWDMNRGRVSPEAWTNLKPYVLREGGAWPYQDDGMGCWGRANANGPGFARLIAQLDAGESGYIDAPDDWDAVQPGDFVKIFWNSTIGADSESGAAEAGHMVILLRREPTLDAKGKRDDTLYYWSSNGRGTMPDGGYGMASCRISNVRRAVWTRVTRPEAFDRAAAIAPDDTDAWLSALDGRHTASVDELRAALSGGDMGAWLSD